MAKMTVEDTSLTAVADAIRTAKGTTNELTFPDGFTDSIGELRRKDYTYSILDRSATEITADMLQGITKIGNSATYGLPNLVSAEIPEGVIVADSYFLNNCFKLKYVTLPSTLKSIGSSSFGSQLKRIVCKAITPPALSNRFNMESGGQVIIPKGTLESYQNATNWSIWADYMVESEDF